MDPVQSEAEAAAIAAEHEMFAAVLSELFRGVLAPFEPQDWHDTAVERLSRGASPTLWASLIAAHAAGLRLEPRAAALAEAIDMLCDPEPKPSGRYDFPTELAVLVVTRGVANAVRACTRSGGYISADDVVGRAVLALASGNERQGGAAR